MEYSGYGYANPAGAESGISPIANLLGFAVVDVNMRGTGCSGGAYDYFERIEQLGGVVAAIKENFFQAEIADSAFQYQREVESEQRVIVGVNRYQTEGQPEVEIHRVDPALETEQIARVRELRSGRDSGAVEAALGRLKEDAGHDDRNLMGPIMDASRAYVTMGEMCDALREVWGAWRETPVF